MVSDDGTGISGSSWIRRDSALEYSEAEYDRWSRVIDILFCYDIGDLCGSICILLM